MLSRSINQPMKETNTMFANASPALISQCDLSKWPVRNSFLAEPGEVHFMLDLETLATTHDAAITEIGCVCINTGKTFHAHVIDNLGRREPGTIAWRLEYNLQWKTVADAADNCYPLYVALSMFFDWLRLEATEKKIVMWCKGTDFDKVITTGAAKSVDLEVPWKYNDFFDIRTLLKVYPQFKVPKEAIEHSALADAVLQTGQLLQIARFVGPRHYSMTAETGYIGLQMGKPNDPN